MKGQNRSIRSPAGYIMFDGIRQAPPHLRTNRPSLSDTHLWLVLAREGSPVLDHSHVSHVFLLYPTPTPTQDMISVQRLCVHGLMNFLGTPTPDLCLQMSQVWVRLSAQMSQKWSEKWVCRWTNPEGQMSSWTHLLNRLLNYQASAPLARAHLNARLGKHSTII